ncbi:Hypothetical predicted protein [Octopus vulgaris]|uniref:Uncharacterized protein n=1 Tax=Octopus vulgaris TaxID=6645 RepID=A0AA36F328_OCTVU|nr:Hypothetical predicted protein [Octopus vulgaris]
MLFFSLFSRILGRCSPHCDQKLYHSNCDHSDQPNRNRDACRSHDACINSEDDRGGGSVGVGVGAGVGSGAVVSEGDRKGVGSYGKDGGRSEVVIVVVACDVGSCGNSGGTTREDSNRYDSGVGVGGSGVDGDAGKLQGQRWWR